MAPLAPEPRHLLVVLNPTRRRALYTLLYDITAFMRSQLELEDGEHGKDSPSSRTNAAEGDQKAVPLFVSENSIGSRDGEPDEPAVPKATPPNPELISLRKAAIAHFDSWRNEVMTKVKELVSSPDDAKIKEARRNRLAIIEKRKADVPEDGESLISFDDAPAPKRQPGQTREVMALQELYHPIPSKFTTLPNEDRKEVLSSFLILLLSTGNYSAHSRALSIYLTSAFELPLSVLIEEETEIAKSLMESSIAADKVTMSADAEAAKRRQENQASRYWKVGLASVAGAAVIGITGGLAAPVVAGALGGLMGSVGLGGVAHFLGIFWMNGALVGTLFGAFGAKMTVSPSTSV
jgi:hypothetical protein